MEEALMSTSWGLEFGAFTVGIVRLLYVNGAPTHPRKLKTVLCCPSLNPQDPDGNPRMEN